MNLDEYSINDVLHDESLVCFKLQLVSVYCFLLFLLAFFFNLLLLVTFCVHKELRTTFNFFIIALTAINFLGTVLELPFVIISNFYCRWMFGRFFCVVNAFLMYWIGCSNIYLLTAVSYERLFIVTNISTLKKLDKSHCVKIVAGCLLLGLVWPTLPLFGWSHYSLEGMNTSCSVEWNDNSMNVFSYNLTIFICVFIIPLFILVSNNLQLIIRIKKFNARQLSILSLKKLKRRMRVEKNLSFYSVILIACYLITWTPYALVSMYRVLIDSKGVDPMYGTIPALFAKSSLVWTSLLYILLNKQIKNRLFVFRRLPSTRSIGNDSFTTKV